MNKICISKSYTSGSGVALVSYPAKSANSKNYLLYSSISFCGRDLNTGYVNLYFDYGQQNITNTNISNNIGTGFSAYILEYSNGAYGISFSSIRNNSNSGNVLTTHSYSGVSNDICMIKNCNYINNPKCANALLAFNDNAMVDSCSIVNNIASNIFQISSNTVTVSKTYTDSNTKTGNGNLNIQSTVKEKSIVPLIQKSSGNCIIVLIHDQKIQYQCTIIHYDIHLTLLNSRTIYILILLN